MSNNVRILNPNFTVDLEQIDCCNCGVVFALPVTILNERRKRGGNFHCPNGHSMVFTETEMDRLKKRLNDALADANQERSRGDKEWIRAQAEKKRADALAAEQARQKKRASAGVCSCCNRTFQNLARHMATKHKEPKA